MTEAGEDGERKPGCVGRVLPSLLSLPLSALELFPAPRATRTPSARGVPGPGPWARGPRFLSPVFGAPGGEESFQREEAYLTSHSCSRFDPRSPRPHPEPARPETPLPPTRPGCKRGSLAGPRRAARRCVLRPAKAQISTVPGSRSAGTAERRPAHRAAAGQ